MTITMRINSYVGSMTSLDNRCEQCRCLRGDHGLFTYNGSRLPYYLCPAKNKAVNKNKAKYTECPRCGEMAHLKPGPQCGLRKMKYLFDKIGGGFAIYKTDENKSYLTKEEFEDVEKLLRELEAKTR
jgi:hypothetical protein